METGTAGLGSRFGQRQDIELALDVAHISVHP
jgi:hypothetical protein